MHKYWNIPVLVLASLLACEPKNCYVLYYYSSCWLHNRWKKSYIKKSKSKSDTQVLPWKFHWKYKEFLPRKPAATLDCSSERLWPVADRSSGGQWTHCCELTVEARERSIMIHVFLGNHSEILSSLSTPTRLVKTTVSASLISLKQKISLVFLRYLNPHGTVLVF